MNVLQQRSYLRDRQTSLSGLSSAGIKLADVYPLADQLQQRKFQPRRCIILLDKNLFLAAISLHLYKYKAISEDRESIDEVAVMLTMAAMTTSLSGLSVNAPNTRVIRECPVGSGGGSWG